MGYPSALGSREISFRVDADTHEAFLAAMRREGFTSVLDWVRNQCLERASDILLEMKEGAIAEDKARRAEVVSLRQRKFSHSAISAKTGLPYRRVDEILSEAERVSFNQRRVGS